MVASPSNHEKRRADLLRLMSLKYLSQLKKEEAAANDPAAEAEQEEWPDIA